MQSISDLKIRHDLILGALGEGVYGIDKDGKGTFVNEAAVAMLGWSGAEILGAPLHDIHHHSHPDGTPYPREECPIYAALRDGEIHEVCDEVFWHSNGTTVSVEYTSTPVLENDEIVGAVVVFRDISRRRKLEKERAEAFEKINALKEQLEQECHYLRDELKTVTNYRGIIGKSEALKRTLAQINAVAETPVSVLIQGESGVGKEGIARAIHERSSRAEAPLVKVNCASIPAELFESEFFGHVKGAFTGAHQDRTGRLQLADGGTLFLDEIGEVPLRLQSKLLRALQEQEFERVGDDRTQRVDVRVVAATNRELKEEVNAGRFREDLYYRLNVFPIEVPPLRERREDIALLAQHFIQVTCEEFRRAPPRVTHHQVKMLERHSWPGNIRELKNVIERSVILSPGANLNLEQAFVTDNDATPLTSVAEQQTDSAFLTETEFRAMEKANLKAALDATGWRISGDGGTAQLMGLKPSTVAYRMKQFDLKKQA